MPICIECSSECDRLYIEPNKGDIRLTICSKCHNFVDKYLESDFVILLLDLMLLEKQAFRHLLYNIDRDRYIQSGFLKIYLFSVILTCYLRFSFLIDEKTNKKLLFTENEYKYYEIIIEYFLENIIFVIILIIQLKIMNISYSINNLIEGILLSSFVTIGYLLCIIWNYELYYIIFFKILHLLSLITSLNVTLNINYFKGSLLLLNCFLFIYLFLPFHNKSFF